MKFATLILPATISLLGFFSCNQIVKETVATTMELDDAMQTYTSDSLGYALSVPNFMKKVTTLHADASLQFQNIFKESYVIVIAEPKEDVINTFEELGEYNHDSSVVKNYRDIQLKYITESTKIETKTAPIASKINGLNAETVKIDGLVDGVKEKISYTYTFVEGSKNVYLISAWTLQDKKEKNEEYFNKIINSFKEIPVKAK